MTNDGCILNLSILIANIVIFLHEIKSIKIEHDQKCLTCTFFNCILNKYSRLEQ